MSNRKTGWYWIRKRSLLGILGEWEPAKYIAEVRCWYSIEFFGVIDDQVLVGEAIIRPGITEA